MSNNRKFVYFLIPPVDERIIYYLRPFFEAKGFVIELFEYGYDDDYEKEIDYFFKGEEDSAVVIYPEDISLFSDRWAEACIKKKRGCVKNVIQYILSKGIPAIPYPMDWGGPFDDAVILYGDDEANANEIIGLIENNG